MKVIITAVRGDVRYFTSLCNTLSKTCWVTALCPTVLTDDRLEKAVDVITLPQWASPKEAVLRNFDFMLLSKFLQILKKVKPDVVHVSFEAWFPLAYYHFVRQVFPLVATLHEPFPFFSTSPTRTLIINPLYTRQNILVCRIADRIIVHGNNHKSRLMRKKVPENRISVIPHGDMRFLETCHATPSMIHDPSEQVILFLGRIWPYKGIEYLLQAMSIIEKRFLNIRLIIAGQGDFSPYQRLANKLRKFTLLNKFLTNQEVAGLLQNASVVVFPYIAASQTGWISAAYTFKKPVVATNTGNFGEMVQDGKTGLLVPTKNAEALATAILKLLTNKKVREQFGISGFQLMCDEMSWEMIGEKTSQVYREVIESRQL
jgi:glycosyltransferase involved in cell wall biosynthesis